MNAAHRKPAIASGTAQNGKVSKQKQSKSRNGCTTCKKKRLKCDETKPRCNQCQRRKVPCEGYKKDYKWRSFEEATFTTKPMGKVRKGSTQNGNESLAPTAASPTHSSNGFILNPEDDFHVPLLSPYPENRTRSEYGLDAQRFLLSQGQHEHAHLYRHRSEDFDLIPHSDEEIQDMMGSAALPASNHEPNLLQERQIYGMPLHDITLNHSLPTAAGLSEHRGPLQDDFDEEIPRNMDSTHFNRWSHRPASPAFSESSTSSESSLMVIPRLPRRSASSTEMLMARFDQETCGILSVKDGPSENPWRIHILPLLDKSPALWNAIKSMSALHGSKNDKALLMNGVNLQNKSIRELVSGIESMNIDNSLARVDASLATVLALAFSDSWDGGEVKTGIAHLRGARAMVANAVETHKKAAIAGIGERHEAQRLRFLCNTYVYIDVLARLTSLEDTDHQVNHDHFETIMSTVNGPLHEVSEVDPLLGCAHSLFPIIGRVANLVQKVRKTQTNSYITISQAADLKEQLQKWRAPNKLRFERPEDPSSEVEHSISTAEAYRWATLLYLHQAVPEIPSEPSPMLAGKILTCLASVPLSSRAVIVQIFPLLAASCEVVEQEDRAFVRQRWQAMVLRLQIRNVDRCLEIVEEVWKRRDAYQSKDLDLDPVRQRHAAMTEPSSGNTGPPMLGSCKRKATTMDTFDTHALFNDPTPAARHGPAMKRRVTMDQTGRPMGSSAGNTELMQPSTAHSSQLDDDARSPEYTVRGSLHWLGVMKDHNWEGKQTRFGRLVSW